MNVSIIIPLYNPDKEILERLIESLKKQKFNGKIEVLKIDKKLGLAESMNYGIKKARYDIIVTLHQDCVPENENWLSNLTAPLKEEENIASVSKVELPYEFWKKFSFIAKIMSAKEQRIITPLLDEKGCAYKKEVLIQVGLFNEREYKTAGEDFDMYLKLKGIGKIAYPDAKILHYHKHTNKNRFKKELQLSEGFGVLVRRNKTKMPKWWLGIIKAIPILGWPIFLVNFPYKKWIIGGLFWILFSLIVNFVYSYGFWKGIIRGKQGK